MFTRWILRLAFLVASLLLLFYFGLYLFQDRIIFQSVDLDRNYEFQFDTPFEEVFIPVPNGNALHDTLNAVLFRTDSSRGWILYFHGNRGNLQRWGRIASSLTAYGYDVLVVDYRGYGKSTGSPSEAALYSDAREVYKWSKDHLQGDHFVLYGRSLGSAVASNLAAAVRPPLLILETPFDELRSVIAPYARGLEGLLPVKYSFSNAENLRSVPSRVVIFHGTVDNIVPLESAMRLRGLLKNRSDFVVIPGGTHRNLGTFPEYREKLKEVLAGSSF